MLAPLGEAVGQVHAAKEGGARTAGMPGRTLQALSRIGRVDEMTLDKDEEGAGCGMNPGCGPSVADSSGPRFGQRLMTDQCQMDAGNMPDDC